MKRNKINIFLTAPIFLSFLTMVWASNTIVRDPDLFNSKEDRSENITDEITALNIEPQKEYAFSKDNILPLDSPITGSSDIPFPFNDNSYSPFSSNDNRSIYLKDPSNINSEFVYNPETGHYEYVRKMGDRFYRPPTYMTFKEYMDYRIEKGNKDYWRNRTKAESLDEGKAIIPKIHVGGEMFDRIFGGNTVDIKPQGTAEMIFGVMSNRIDNPAIAEKMRRQTNFDFNQRIQLNVIGNVGEKLKLVTNYNTEATFDFENQMKMEYTGFEDEIIKKIEAGNVSLPLTGTLITGSQSLFGIKTQLQFGRLTATSVFSQQKGKKQEIETSGGAQTMSLTITADNYEYNKHFFLAQYFRDNFDKAMEGMPIVGSTVNITKVEVWVTNSNSAATTNTRDVVAFMDLGEASYYDQTGFVTPGTGNLPDNSVNSLYSKVKDLSQVRNFASASTYLNQNTGLEYATGFDIASRAKLLSPNEYTFHPQLGFISLNQTLNPDQVLAVAFQYTVGGSDAVHQVGEFSTDGVPEGKSLLAKLLKSTNLNVGIPTWDLMMKNIYSLGAFNINQDGFRLDVVYSSITQGNDVNYIPEGIDATKGKPLIQVLNLDRLNAQSDLKPDGIFDFLPGRTINPANGRIMFPVVEPFGDHLRKKITGGDPNFQAIANKYVYDPLYDTTKIAAQQRPDLNRFKIKCTYKSSSSSEISLNAFNVPKGSVTVTAAGAPLTEGVDYTVDYNMGKVKIINQSLLESNTNIKVSLENNATFGMQQKSLFGTHFDYRVNNDFNIGATIMNLNERPLTQKVNFGDEPMSNTIWGVDANYKTETPFLTKLVDKLPFLSTKEMSSITYNGEFAQLIPGNNKAIGNEGVSYIDDFEASQTTIDLKSQISWMLSSTPSNQPSLFPEGDLVNDLRYGFNRAKLSWYNIDVSVFYGGSNSILMPAHLKGSEDLSNNYSREIVETEIFPNRIPPGGVVSSMQVMNLAYFPTERGPYNYDVGGSNYSGGINIDGTLKNPKTRWAGIMRKVDNTDFVTQNISYIQFWVMDPFHEDNGIDGPNGQYNHKGGDLYFNLGNVSEDVLRDDAKGFENGLAADGSDANSKYTAWGRVSTLQSLVFAFDNDPKARKFQDVGFDGMDDDKEKQFFDSTYISKIAALYGTGSQAYLNAINDPSADNFHYFRGSDYDSQEKGITERYKDYNGTEGNSSTEQPEGFPISASTIPNIEDINKDNTLSTNESYYQYKVSLRPQDMVVGKNFITDKVRGEGIKANGQTIDVDWYQFKIPIRTPEKVIGNIQDFTSIRFVRMFLKNFEQPVICRFGRLEFVRGDWRKYDFDLNAAGEYIETDDKNTYFDVGAVNIEENGEKTPVNYILPPEINRQIDVGTSNLRKLNEQSLVLKVCDLGDGEARAAYKNSNLDVRSYKKLKMFVHAESPDAGNVLKNGDLTVFVRLGRDYSENYYEYEIPLMVTPHGVYDGESESQRLAVWPAENNIEIIFDELTKLKLDRNKILAPINQPYSRQLGKGTGTVVGNPNLTAISTVMVGIRNKKKQGLNDGDDGMAKCAEVWVNELRLTDFDKSSGWAANSRVTTKLADFGSVTVSGNMSTPGFGSIEKKISDRQRSTNKQYDISSSFELGKILPQAAGLKVPVFLGYSEAFIDPQYDPNDPDVLFAEKLSRYDDDPAAQEEIKRISRDYTLRKSLNFTNVKMEKGKGGKGHFYDASNFAFTYSYNEMIKRDINTLSNITRTYKGLVTYNYSFNPKNYTPFEEVKLFSKSKYAKPIKEFNFYLLPSRISITSGIDRFYNENAIRNTSFDVFEIAPTYSKNILMTRTYQFNHDFTKNIKMDFTANNNGRVFEPEGPLDTQGKRDTVWQNIKNLGVNTTYNHAANLNYTAPLSSFPLTDWMTASGRYGTTYDWTRAPFAADSLGSVIRNSNSKQLNASLNMNTLYNKVPYFKKLNQPGKKSANKASKDGGEVQAKGGKKKDAKKIKVSYKKENVKLRKDKPKKIKHKLDAADVVVKVKDGKGKDVAGKVEIINHRKFYFIPERDADSVTVSVDGEKEKKEIDLGKVPNALIGMVLGLKTVSGTYTRNEGTILPGFRDSTMILGMGHNNSLPGYLNSPGWEFVSGKQFSDTAFAAYAARNKMLREAPGLNTQFSRTTSENYNLRANLEPFKDLKIELNVARNESYNYTSFFRWDSIQNGFIHQTPMETGNFSMSFSSWRTAFVKDNDDNSNDIFNTFLEYRKTISERLSNENDNSQNYDPNTQYYEGYGANSQDVIIPAFLAAYSGSSPSLTSLKYIPDMPLPNWSITYSGLSKIAFFKKYFKSVTLKHAYRSTYSIANFSTNLRFVPDDKGFTDVTDINGNFVPKHQITQISISEQFSPLINVDLTWINKLITKVELKKDRTLAFNFADGRLQEIQGKEIILGGGYSFDQVPFPFKLGPTKATIKSDLNLRADVTIRNNKTITRSTDKTNQATAGQNVVSIKTSADYAINKSLQLRLFFDKVITNPVISTSFPSSNTNAGISVRFALN